MIRAMRPEDAEAMVDVILTALRVTNAKDYDADFLEGFARGFSAESILRRAAEGTHFYVACEDARVVGCGAVAPCGERSGACEIQTVFILPQYQGAGLGRRIVETLEADPLARRARRVELSASITAAGFYERLGYRYKNGKSVLNETLGHPMEKLL